MCLLSALIDVGMYSSLFGSRSIEITKQIPSVVYYHANDMPTEINKAFSEKQFFFDEIRPWLSSTVHVSFLFFFFFVSAP